MRTSIAQQNNVSNKLVALIKRLVAMIPWPFRRVAMADVTETLMEGKARATEDTFGWGRFVVQKGMHEPDGQNQDHGDISGRHRKSIEEKFPHIILDIKGLFDPQSQADARLSNTLRYLNASASAVREALLQHGYSNNELPTVRTISNLLGRMGYRLRSVEKSKPQKKIAETDQIFDNVHRLNAEADADPQSIRISIDTKAAVNIGEFSRHGKSRCAQAVRAIDHDMFIKEKLIPVGVLEPATGRSFIAFGNHTQTSDMIVDGIEQWLASRKPELDAQGITKLVVNSDNGPDCSSHRTQFLARMIGLADQFSMDIQLAYYPPYHSKYNPIEHYWGGLERNWNGYLLDSAKAVVERAANFMWSGTKTVVKTIFGPYKTGVTHTPKEKKELEKRLSRNPKLRWWDVLIHPLPKTVNQ